MNPNLTDEGHERALRVLWRRERKQFRYGVPLACAVAAAIVTAAGMRDPTANPLLWQYADGFLLLAAVVIVVITSIE